MCAIYTSTFSVFYLHALFWAVDCKRPLCFLVAFLPFGTQFVFICFTCHSGENTTVVFPLHFIVKCVYLRVIQSDKSFYHYLKINKNHKHRWLYSQEVHLYYIRRDGGATQPQLTLSLDIIGCAAHRKENQQRRKKKKMKGKENEERGGHSIGV